METLITLVVLLTYYTVLIIEIFWFFS